MSLVRKFAHLEKLQSYHEAGGYLLAVLFLIVGGISTTVFRYFFGINSIKVQALMTVLVSVTLSSNILLVALYSSPFTGEFGVKPMAFDMDLKMFDGIAKQRTPGP
jgi:hypothetical protein